MAQMVRNTPAVGLATALQVPAFTRALKTYHLIASFPLREYRAEDVVTPRTFLRQPCKITTYSALMQRTVTDLLVYGLAYWRVTERSWDGYPSAIMHMPYTEVSYSPPASMPIQEFQVDGTIYWNGAPIPQRDVIRFDGDGLGGWLAIGATAINTAASLEAAATRAAEVPAPSVVLKNSGADLPAAQVDALLEAWESARSTRSTAYLNSTLSTENVGGWSPNELQMTDARQASAAQMARLTNLDPVWVGAGIPGSSLTYQNRQDLMRNLLDMSLSPVMRTISERLSMSDVTPLNHSVKFEADELLRGNHAELSALISAMQPLGVITTEEGRRMLDMTEMAGIPNA